MTVIPFALTEVGRWRTAITAAASRLCFDLLRTPNEARLAVTLSDSGDDDVEDLAARAFMAVDRILELRLAHRIGGPTTAILIAEVFRNRLLDLLTHTAAPFHSRYAPLEPAAAGRAYADALRAVLHEMIDRKGVMAVRTLALEACKEPISP